MDGFDEVRVNESGGGACTAVDVAGGDMAEPEVRDNKQVAVSQQLLREVFAGVVSGECDD